MKKLSKVTYLKKITFELLGLEKMKTLLKYTTKNHKKYMGWDQTVYFPLPQRSSSWILLHRICCCYIKKMLNAILWAIFSLSNKL